MFRQDSKFYAALAAAALLSACEAQQPTEPIGGPRPDERHPSHQAALMQALNCPQLATDANLCLVAEYPGALTLFGLETGQVCPLAAYLPGHGSLGWIGDRVYSCDRESGGVVEASLIDGSVDRAALGTSCMGVTAWGSNIVVHTFSGIDVYASFADIPTSSVARRTASFRATRLATSGDVLYGAWHSTGEIQAFDLASGQDLPAISLAPYDDWIFGLATTQAGELVLLPPSRNGDIQIRDPQTGAIVRTVPQPGRFDAADGMTCGGALFPAAPPPPPPADPVVLDALCATSVSSYDSGSSASPEVHAIGVYEPGPTGAIDVRVERPGDVALVLVAYEAVTWNVAAGPNTNITSVTVHGYRNQTLNAPAGAVTEIVSYETGGSPSLTHAHDWASFEARKLRHDIEETLSAPMRSFGGCYTGKSFVIR